MAPEAGEGLTPAPGAKVSKCNDNMLLFILLSFPQLSWQELPNHQNQQKS